MLISKREFEKLSKVDKAKLMQPKKKQQQPKKKNGPPKAKASGRNSSIISGESQGVASAYAKGVRSNKPNISYAKNGRQCRIQHKEFVTNVIGSVAFTTPVSIQLNPGLPASFPWLSNVANNFETYRVNRMVFKYLTRTGTNVPGSVLMYPDYDAADAAPVSEQIASNYEEICEDAPWKDITCPLRESGMHSIGPKKFVRNAALAANLDIKTYDVGTMFLSTVDGTAVSWGKLWVEYDITFFEPQLFPGGAFTPFGGLVAGGGTLTAGNPFGTVPVPDATQLGYSIDAASQVTFTITGTVLIALQVNGTVITAIAAPTLAGGATTAKAIGAVINSGGTVGIGILVLNVVPGSTASFSATATTITASFIEMGLGPVGSFA